MSMSTSVSSTQMALPTGTAETELSSFECMRRFDEALKACGPIMKEIDSLDIPLELDKCLSTKTCSQEQKNQVYGQSCPLVMKAFACVHPVVDPCFDHVMHDTTTFYGLNKECEAFSGSKGSNATDGSKGSTATDGSKESDVSEGFTATMQLSVLGLLLLLI